MANIYDCFGHIGAGSCQCEHCKAIRKKIKCYCNFCEIARDLEFNGYHIIPPHKAEPKEE